MISKIMWWVGCVTFISLCMLYTGHIWSDCMEENSFLTCAVMLGH